MADDSKFNGFSGPTQTEIKNKPVSSPIQGRVKPMFMWDDLETDQSSYNYTQMKVESSPNIINTPITTSAPEIKSMLPKPEEVDINAVKSELGKIVFDQVNNEIEAKTDDNNTQVSPQTQTTNSTSTFSDVGNQIVSLAGENLTQVATKSVDFTTKEVKGVFSDLKDLVTDNVITSGSSNSEKPQTQEDKDKKEADLIWARFKQQYGDEIQAGQSQEKAKQVTEQIFQTTGSTTISSAQVERMHISGSIDTNHVTTAYHLKQIHLNQIEDENAAKQAQEETVKTPSSGKKGPGNVIDPNKVNEGVSLLSTAQTAG